MPSELTDQELVSRTLRGDQRAYAEIVMRYQDRLRVTLSFYFHSREAIEEQLQETFVQAYVNLNTFDQEAPLFPWLKGMAVNLTKMELRRLKTARRKGVDYLRFLQLSNALSSPKSSIADRMSEALQGCLQKLKEKDLSLLRLKYGEQWSTSQLADRNRSTEGALKLKLHRLRDVLRRCIQTQLGMGAEGKA